MSNGTKTQGEHFCLISLELFMPVSSDEAGCSDGVGVKDGLHNLTNIVNQFSAFVQNNLFCQFALQVTLVIS